MASDEERTDLASDGSAFDLLTIGLLVFFVSLLLVVAALLVLPAIMA